MSRYFNELLEQLHIEPADVCIMRHTPRTKLVARNDLERWVREERPRFEDYQRGQGLAKGKTAAKRRYLASFIGGESGKATFVGLYQHTRKPHIDSNEQFYRRPENKRLVTRGMRVHRDGQSRYWFYLKRVPQSQSLEFRLVIDWQGQNWCRKAETNKFRIAKFHFPKYGAWELENLKQLDKLRRVKTRVEQAVLRKFMLDGRDRGRCYVCREDFPAELLTCAHIKPRAKCSDQQKRDRANTVPMCLLGCDALFERGRIAIVDGRVEIRHYEHEPASRLRALLQRLHGRRIFVERERQGYFAWRHRRAARSLD